MDFSLGLDNYRYRRHLTNIKTLSQKREFRAYTGLVLTLLTVAFFAFFAIRPTLVTVASLMKEIKDKEMIAQKLEEKISSLSLARSEYEAVSSELSLVEEALPQKPNLSLLVRQIETLAVQSGVVLQAIQFDETPLLGESTTEKESAEESAEEEIKEEGLSAVPFSLTVSGDYQSLKNFLQNLEEFRRLIVPSSFTFEKEKTKEGEQLLLSVAGQAYYFIQTKRE